MTEARQKVRKRCQIPRNSVLKRIQGYFRMLCASSDEYFFATDIVENIVMLSPNMVTDFGMPAEVFMDISAIVPSSLLVVALST